MNKINAVFVAGAGLMGSGIAHSVITNAKLPVYLYDLSDEFLQKGVDRIKATFAKSIEKNLMTEGDVKYALSLLHTTLNLEDAKNTELVIEAVAEKIEIKKDLFEKLDKICSKETIFASNTSSLPITKIATSTTRSDKFIGMHFFSPVDRMKLIEIIKGTDTSKETFETIKSFTEQLNKQISVSEDYPGFITTRLGVVLINEAAFCLFEGVGTAEDIDLGMKLGYNHPIGPLALADAIGLDVCLSILDIMYDEYKDSKYRACPLFRKLINAGHLGKKTKKGFYNYT
ncbi:MAG: 3-hydroxybutyryl-CoA dehydrogenase [Candidatus Sericytochromatia bacterium]|nr:3-hydroxybutyryl-CoA dehydrogenase [Candidatus Sericytochromatia bacterium]